MSAAAARARETCVAARPAQVIRAFDSAAGVAVGPPLVGVALGQIVSVTLELTMLDDQARGAPSRPGV